MESLRVAALQYFIRPVREFDEFASQVRGLVRTAADYHCHLMLFPEYFTAQLLTLGDVYRPIREQIRDLADELPRFRQLMRALARDNGLYIVAGSIPVRNAEQPDVVHNASFIFHPSGECGVQEKLHMTRWETEEWDVAPCETLRIFETAFGRMAIAICYDVEFPEIARSAAREGVNVLLVPSCTDDRQGFLRVRYCAQARAIENHMYVVHATTVGSLPMVPAVSLNYGQASILTPSDFGFARDGILAEGVPNQESMVIGDLDLERIQKVRSFGTVLPLLDSERSRSIARHPEIVRL